MPGDLVDGRYELLDVIASGGMATVWRARDNRLDRIVALKRPHPSPPGDPGPERLAREARIAATLSHPNLITVYDAGEDEAGHPYLVMEWVEGPSLAVTDLSPAQAVAVGSQLADALAAIHHAGIIHRDVKPANVILSERGPQLTDFGIALSLDPTTPLTEPGTVIATPSYAAPEVLSGSEPTAAADVFSLAAVIYELISGRPPYDGPNRPEPPPLDDPALDAILRECLSSEPGARPTAARLAEMLRGETPTVPVSAISGSTQVLGVTSSTLDDPPPPTRGQSMTSGTRLLVGLVALTAIAFVVLAMMNDNNDASPVDTTTEVVTTAANVAAPPPTVTPVPTVSPTDVGDDTTEEAAEAREEVDEARADVVEEVEEFHPSGLSPADAREILALVDEAVSAAEAGDGDSAGDYLASAYRKARDSVRRDSADDLLDALEELAHALDRLLAANR